MLAAAGLGGARASDAATPGTISPPMSEALATHEGEGFAIEVSDASGPVGERRKVAVTIRAKSGFKFNEQFPSQLQVTRADGIAVDKDVYGRGDGRLVGGKTFTYEVEVAAEHVGAHELHASLRFSVCNDSACFVGKREVVATVTGQ